MTKKNLEQLENDAIESVPYLASDEKSSNLKDASFSLYKSDLSSSSQTPSWVHFVAGGIGGMAGAIATCPFDVVKTRLQSDVFQSVYKSHVGYNRISLFSKGIAHFKETFAIISHVYGQEGFRSLFKGLGPNLVGVIPARSINFFTYGASKDLYSRSLNNGEEAPWIHLISAATAGWATSTATNPIWLIKTRLQLDKTDITKQHRNSWECLNSIMKNEGISGLYKGLSASYLGSIEGIVQWILYEQMKLVIRERSIEKFGHIDDRRKTNYDKVKEWCQRSGSAGLAKFFASIMTYPHEVVRTRLRQAPMDNGVLKYTGLVQSFKIIIKEEGIASMYSGLTPHLLRTVPNSIIMFGTWELVIKLLSP